MQPDLGTLKTFPFSLAAHEALVLVAKAGDVLSTLPAERLALPAEESERIARYKNEDDRRARQAAHGLVRHVLGTLLSRAPQDVHFTRDELGRPFLAQNEGIDFNLSHSGGWIVVGISRHGRIGVDVQEGHEPFDWESVSRAYLHADEIKLLHGLPRSGQAGAALKLWCLKEAFLKATGEGLATPPHRLLPQPGKDCWRLSHQGFELKGLSLPLSDGSCAAWACELGVEPMVVVL